MIDERELSERIEQYTRDGDLGEWLLPKWYDQLCGYCRKPVEFSNGFVEILSDYPTSVGYPDERIGARCVLTHHDCGPSTGYWVPLNELAFDGESHGQPSNYQNWLNHLQSKRWFTADVYRGLEFARRTAARLRTLAQVRAEAETIKDRTQSLRPVKRAHPTNANPRSISLRTRTRVMERDHFTCRRCGHKAPDVLLVVDHIIPVAKGGTADESNLQTLCRDCNAGKSDRDPHPHDLGRIE